MSLTSSLRSTLSRVGEQVRSASALVEDALTTTLGTAAAPKTLPRALRSRGGAYPVVSTWARVDEKAVLVGRVWLGDGVTVGADAVLRGDDGSMVVVGQRSVVGDGATLVASPETPVSKLTGLPLAVRVGRNVVVGPQAVLDACVVQDGATIGARAVVGEGAVVEAGAAVGDDTVIPPGRRVPAGEKWVGNPAKFAGMVEVGH